MKMIACAGAGLLARVSLQTSPLRFYGVSNDKPCETVKILKQGRNGGDFSNFSTQSVWDAKYVCMYTGQQPWRWS